MTDNGCNLATADLFRAEIARLEAEIARLKTEVVLHRAVASLSVSEREAVEQAVEAMQSRGMTRQAAWLRGLLERLQPDAAGYTAGISAGGEPKPTRNLCQ